MSAILNKINRRFRILKEEAADTSWKDVNNPDYDRQVAEDALFHTIGPLTENPKWKEEWTSPSTPVPGFTPGGPAPRWTPDEVVLAFAGDPRLLFGGSGNPRSPKYGKQGGSPLYRTARKVSRIYAKGTDPSFLEDMYSNGFIALTRMMQPGQDKSMAGFISYAIRNVKSAMEHGIGGENRTSAAGGYEAKVGEEQNIDARGLKSLIDETDPQELRRAASIVKGKYQDEVSHDRTDDNPLGRFSAPYYQTVMYYADALESGDEESIAAGKKAIEDLITQINDYGIKIGGASTGLGQAIDTPDRKTSIGIASMDAPAKAGEDNAGSMAANIPEVNPSSRSGWIDPESIDYILDIALTHDLGAILASSEKYNAMATDMKAKKGKIGGKMTVNEFRYTLRTLGRTAGLQYPGKGKPRSNTQIPRDARGWWVRGEDPEIEPLPMKTESKDPIYEGLWHSIWSREGYESMGPQAIADEMTMETKEFNEYGIPTAREVKVKKKGGNTIEEVVSKVAVFNTVKAATVKLKVIADIYAGQLGLDINESIAHNNIIAEDIMTMDKIDRDIIAESAYAMIQKINRVMVFESNTNNFPSRGNRKYFAINSKINESKMFPVSTIE